MEDFITDKVEYLSDHLPSSSEESAHSTDEEGNKKRHRKASGDAAEGEEEPSAHETESEPEDTPEPSDAEVNEDSPAKTPDPTSSLIGKAALAAKRAQGLLPPKPSDTPKPHHSSKKHHKHRHKEEKKHKHKDHSHKKTDKESKKYVQFGEFDTPEARMKADLVTKILVRWWYVLPDWPPQMDYASLLHSSQLRLVDSANWLTEPQFDAHGREKVRELAGYRGVFQNSKGILFDLRDKSTCPSFNNLFAKTAGELKKLLLTALENQLGELQRQADADPKLVKELGRELKLVAGT